MSNKLIAEALGTLILVLFGCGSAVLMGTQIGFSGIAAAFGLAIVVAAYGLGAISGAHLNPAVSLGMVAAGRMIVSEFVGYSIAQIIGAIAGASILYLIASGKADYVFGHQWFGSKWLWCGVFGRIFPECRADLRSRDDVYLCHSDFGINWGRINGGVCRAGDWPDVDRDPSG